MEALQQDQPRQELLRASPDLCQPKVMVLVLHELTSPIGGNCSKLLIATE
jgi:hypothetical protein